LRATSARFWDAIECGFVVLALLLFSGALIPLLIQGSSEASVDANQGGSASIQAVWLVTYGTAFLFAVLRWNRFRWQRGIYLATKDKLLLALVGLALISVLWSAVPEVTLRRGIALLLTTLFGLDPATRFELSEQLRLLYWALIIAAVLSLGVALVVPSYGITPSSANAWSPETTAEGWRGIYYSKNIFGRLMALSGVVSLLFAISTRKYRLLNWTVFGLSLSLLLLAKSATSLLVFLVTVVFFLPLYRGLRWRYTLAAPFFIVMILGGGFAMVWGLGNADTLLTALGKDLTLTGRTSLWSALLEMIELRPWFGYGYEGFWQSYGEQWSVSYTGWQTSHAHNGFLELGLGLGLFGLLLFVLGFFDAFLRAVSWAQTTGAQQALWPLLYLTFLMLSNVTYTTLLQQNSLWWVLYVATILSTYLTYAKVSTKNQPTETTPDLRVSQNS
jgi:exopolysaccharide production protein ExoQ